jgi:hypothetical protein
MFVSFPYFHNTAAIAVGNLSVMPETCLYKAVGNLSVMPSLLPHVL